MIPTATYRLQFGADLTFRDAKALVPYLSGLGVSHVYASPVLKTRAGSSHGYDITDHNALNPLLGTEQDFRKFVAELHGRNMKLILDIVPNHMAVGGSDNRWWLDVLEHGEASLYSGYFDIDWHPPSRLLNNKLLLPFLGDYYGSVLERGELVLKFEVEEGGFHIAYFDHVFPIDPMTYPFILNHQASELKKPDPGEQGSAQWQSLIQTLRSMPRRGAMSKTRSMRRRETGNHCKQLLSRLCENYPAIQRWIGDVVEALNCNGEIHDGYNRLHRLLEKQAFRLAYWKVAADMINYRRFFDINELAGIRIEDEEVFTAVHGYLGGLIREGLIDGFRIDHIDGLADPPGYCRDLGKLVQPDDIQQGPDGSGAVYTVVEKILAADEELKSDWGVQGTTGYEFAALVNGLFIHPDGEAPLTALYEDFLKAAAQYPEQTGQLNRFYDPDISRLIYRVRKFIMRHTLAGELSVLANRLSRIAQEDRNTRDFTRESLRQALMDVLAWFSVYRTYLSPGQRCEQDLEILSRAVGQGSLCSQLDRNLFDFIYSALTTGTVRHPRSRIERQCAEFCRLFQQYTPMVAAKSLEDTAGYRYNRLVSLNDVGFDLSRFAIPAAVFHEKNRRRLAQLPDTMVATSTHDSKRGEDVRARINVLSEMPELWRHHALHWQRLNAGKKMPVNGQPAPCPNDEYLLYQTLTGTWPFDPDLADNRDYKERIVAYMIKAAREAKIHTSWVNPGDAYEQALSGFIEAIFDDKGAEGFVRDFLLLQSRIARPGLYNALSQTLLKLMSPGVPDIYQGNELWSFALVDPDNRRAVDFSLRRELLRESSVNRIGWDQCVAAVEDGYAKFILTRKALELRRRYPALFRLGDYLPLEPRGPGAKYIVAFARIHQGKTICIAVTRWLARLPEITDPWPIPIKYWENTWLVMPPGDQPGHYCDVLSGDTIETVSGDGEMKLAVADIFKRAPVSLLESVPVTANGDA